MSRYSIYVYGAGHNGYLDRDGNLRNDPDLMEMETARDAFDNAIKRFPSDVELTLWVESGYYSTRVELRHGEADEEGLQ